MNETLQKALNILRHLKHNLIFKQLPLRIIKKILSRNGYGVIDLNFIDDRIVTNLPPKIQKFMYKNTEYKFFIANRDDYIQSFHLRKELYEERELEIISKYFVPESTFIDVGANIGNHSIYALLELGARKAVAFEPALFQHTVLCFNAALNDVSEKFEIQKIALSDWQGVSRVKFGGMRNWGGSRIDQSSEGELIRVDTGDNILQVEGPAFLKIDVEGHELRVLNGMESFINRIRPLIFIEVNLENDIQFNKWVKSRRYQICRAFKEMGNNRNYLIIPNELL